MDFRLHYSGVKPNWGIAFRNPATDVSALFGKTQPLSIEIQFFLGPVYTFGIRPSFWTTKCYEFMDTQVIGGQLSPIEHLFITCLGFTTQNNGKCKITVVRDRTLQTLRLRVTKIEI